MTNDQPKEKHSQAYFSVSFMIEDGDNLTVICQDVQDKVGNYSINEDRDKFQPEY